MASKAAASVKDAPPTPIKARAPRARASKPAETAVEAPPTVIAPEANPYADEPLVDGLRVIGFEPVASNLPPKSNGETIYRKGMVNVLLEDGSKFMRCADCNYTGTLGSIMGHRGKAHLEGPAKPRQTRQPRQVPGHNVPDSVASMSLGDVLEMGRQIETISIAMANVTAQRDEYRDRCTELERELRQIKRSLRLAGFIPEPIEVIEVSGTAEVSDTAEVVA